MEFQGRECTKIYTRKARETTREYYEKKKRQKIKQIEKSSKKRTYYTWILINKDKVKESNLLCYCYDIC